MDDEAARLRSAFDEKKAVIRRIKEYIAPWKNDKRLRTMGDILLGHIERIEREERDERRAP